MLPDIHFATTKNAFFENHQQVKRRISKSISDINLHIFPHDLLFDFDFLQDRFEALEGCHFASDLEAAIGGLSAQHVFSDCCLVSISMTDSEFSVYEVRQLHSHFQFKKQAMMPSFEQPAWAKNMIKQSAATVEKINETYKYWKESGCLEETNLELGQYFQPAEVEVFCSSLGQHFSDMLKAYEIADLFVFLTTDALLQFDAFRDTIFERWNFLRQQENALIELNANWMQHRSKSIWAWLHRSEAHKQLEVHFSNSRPSATCSLRYGGGWFELPGVFPLRLDVRNLSQHFSMHIGGEQVVPSSFPIKNYLPDEEPDFVYDSQPYKMLQFSLCFDHTHYLFLKTKSFGGKQSKFGLFADVSGFI